MESVAGAKLPTGLRDTYFALSFGGTIPAGAWAYDTVDEWSVVTRAINERMLPLVNGLRTTDERLFAAESEHVEKAQVCWRDIGLGALVQWADIDASNPDQATALKPRFVKLGQRYKAWLLEQEKTALREAYLDDKVILSSGKGPPYFFPGLSADAGVALARIAEGANDLTELNRQIRTAGGAMMPMSFVSYPRFQGARKPRPIYAVIGSDLVPHGEKVRCKARRVQAAPFPWNYLIVGVANLLKGAMRNTSNMNSGTTNEAIAASRTTRHTIALDFSSWDESVSHETLTSWRVSVYEPVLRTLVQMGVITTQRMHMLMEIDEAMQIAPQLGPPRGYSEGAVLGGMIGTIRSGERLTSQKGTDIGRELNLLKMERLGIRGLLFNQGDDTIVCTDDDDALDKYLATTSFLGTEQTVAPDAAYLMKRIPGDYAYLGRMVYANVNKEARFEPRNLFHAAGAMWVRRLLLEGHPLAAAYYEVLGQTPGRLGYTAALAKDSDGYDLLRTAASLTRAGGGEEAAVLETILNAADISGRADLGNLAAQIAARTGRTTSFTWLPPGTEQMDLGRFRELLSSVSYSRAAEWIATNSYKKRAYREW